MLFNNKILQAYSEGVPKNILVLNSYHTIDDAALYFALKNRADIFSGAPIVFCGVNTKGINKLSQG
jgi:hypothetical protein